MKLLAVVEENLHSALRHTLGCEIDFRASWREVDASALPEYAAVVASGSLIEDAVAPLTLWGVASEIRYFGLPATFIDVSGEAEGLIPRVYPHIKLATCNGDINNLIKQLRENLPVLFQDGPNLSDSIPSASRQHEEAIKRALSQTDLSGPRQTNQLQKVQSMAQMPGSFGAISSIPLGLGQSRSERQNHVADSAFASPSFRKEGMGSGRSSGVYSEISDALSNAISSVSDISGISDLLESVSSHDLEKISSVEKTASRPKGKTISKSKDLDVPSSKDLAVSKSREMSASKSKDLMVPTSKEFAVPSSKDSGVPSSLDLLKPKSKDVFAPQSREVSSGGRDAASQAAAKGTPLSDSSLAFRRYADDIQQGYVELGTIIHVIQTIIRLKLTGTLEIQNTTRLVKIEFRDGRVSSTSSPALIQSAFAWTQGEYTFNSNRVLSSNAQPIDVRKLFHVAAAQLPINAVMRALEANFSRYAKITDQFRSESYQTEESFEWWKSCGGSTKLADIIMHAGVDMDRVSRDIFLAYLCDEVHFFDAPTLQPIRIQYDEESYTPSPDHSSLSRAINEFAPENSQINVIRSDLIQVRDRFNHENGYSILGLSPGCGPKALDAAYYAWINRYHTDRFVRFKNPEFIKLANEILMLMNAAYAKISKAERRNAHREKAFDTIRNSESSSPKISDRIGNARPRIPTINPPVVNGSDPQQNIPGDVNAYRSRSTNPPRVPVRPASIGPDSRSGAQAAVPHPSSNSSSYLKMSEVLRRQRTRTMQEQDQSNPPNSASNLPLQHRSRSNLPLQNRTSGSDLPGQVRPSGINLASQPRPNITVTPQQHFVTARKKLTLGLAKEALSALECALEAAPDNIDYNLYHAYAVSLVDLEKRDESIERITTLLNTVKKGISGKPDADQSNQLFAANYFLGKIYISVENYEQAAKYIEAAGKLNPSDIDTQRCMRYVTMQNEKQAQQNEQNKGLFSKLKDRFNKPM